MTKLTVRLPERVATQLRERSEADGLSLNETLVRALERGLGRASPDEADEDEWWRGLGDFIQRPPLKKHDPARLDQLREGLDPGKGSIMDDLDWTRSDRYE